MYVCTYVLWSFRSIHSTRGTRKKKMIAVSEKVYVS